MKIVNKSNLILFFLLIMCVILLINGKKTEAVGEPITVNAPVTFSGTNLLSAYRFVDTAGNGTYYIDPSANPSINVAGSVTAPSFAGTLTGNVTGNVSGNASTATNVAYSGITSLPAALANITNGRIRMYELGCSGSWASSCDANTDGWPDYAGTAGTATNQSGGSVDASSATFGTSLYTYLTLRDDESPNGVKYIHANGNLIGFLSGQGGWIWNTDNSGNVQNYGSITDYGNLSVSGTTTLTGSYLSQSGGYAYLGSYNSGNIYPRAGNDLATAWNFTAGGRDVSLWNTDVNNTSAQSFAFRQLNSGPSRTDLVFISPLGVVQANSTITANAFDLAENVVVEDKSIESGDIVAAEPVYNPANWNSKYNAFVAVKTEVPYAKETIGIISEKPGLLMRGYGLDEGTKIDQSTIRPLALSGRVPVKVSTINGVIKVGDPITTSIIKGVGMKATNAGMIVGRALENYSGNSTGKIMVMTTLSWFDPQSIDTANNVKELTEKVASQQKEIDELRSQLIDLKSKIH